VKGPRFRISSVMAFIAVAAIDFVVAMALIGFRTPMDDLLLLGALPMANVLFIIMLRGRGRPESRPFLPGLEVFGATALVLFVLLASVSPHRVLGTYLGPMANAVTYYLGPYGDAVRISVLCTAAAAMLVVPQLAFAVVGCLLFSGSRLSVTRR
jgi:hypothetical protein